MPFILHAWALTHIVAKRLLAQWGLALVTIIGLVASISLMISIPLYADAVYHRTYLEKITGDVATSTNTGDSTSLPFSFMFGYYGSWSGNKEWEEVQPLDRFFTTSTEAVLSLPQKLLIRYFSTATAELYPTTAQEMGYKDREARLGWINLGFMSGLEDHIQILEGGFPVIAAPGKDSVLEVLASLPLANKVGLQVGDNYVVLVTTRSVNDAGLTEEIVTQYPIRIAGIWQPKDPLEPYWMFSPSSLIDVLLVPEGTFVNRLSPSLSGEVYTGVWYMVMDGTNIHTTEVGTLLRRITRLENQASGLLPNIYVRRSPAEALSEYQRAASQLTILLYAFAVPIIGLILAFISLVASLGLERKRNEIAVTRSRGATSLQVLGSIILESVLLGLMALVISLPFAIGLTHVISRTRSFMDFSTSSALHVSLTTPALLAGVLAVVVTLVVTLLPALSTVRQTIVSYKQERARMMRPPVWQRLWLDALLLIPAGYGAYLLSKQGSIVALGSNDPLGNPLLFLVPALCVLALTLVFLRLVPPFMAGIAWLAAHTHNIGLLLAARQLSRSTGYYNIPMLILVFTLSLSTYTASLAQTLDQHLYARTYYRVGADMKFKDIGEPQPQNLFPIPVQGVDSKPQFLFFPVSEYLNIPGIEAVTRVGNFPAISVSGEGNYVNGRFYGIDRVDFPKVAYWRRNFATLSLGALMNALGALPEGILTSRKFLAEAGLQEGDTLRLIISTDVNRVELNMIIVGSFDMFPTWYPDDVPLFVGNLDYLYEQAEDESPYQVWVKTAQNIDTTQLGDVKLRDLNFRVVSWEAARPQIREIQQRPEQQGLFGFLFIGFAAAAILTVVGFFLYALFSYQRQFIELGILRAGGLSRVQMATYMAFELVFLILFGSAVGTGLGVLISTRFIPYLQIGTESAARIPPFQVIVAWPAIFRIYGLFGFLFVAILAVLVVKLQRMKIFQAIKLGETI